MPSNFKFLLFLPLLGLCTLTYEDRYGNLGGTSSTFQPNMDYLANGEGIICIDWELTNVECQVYTANGELVKKLSIVAGYANIYPWVLALPDGGFVINFEGSSNTESIIYNADFSVRTAAFHSETNGYASGRGNLIAFSDSSWAIVYIITGLHVWASKFTSTGTVVWQNIELLANIEYGSYAHAYANSYANDGSFYMMAQANHHIGTVAKFDSSGNQLATVSLSGTCNSNVWGGVFLSTGNVLAIWGTSAGENAEIFDSNLASTGASKLLIAATEFVGGVGIFSDNSFFVAYASGSNGEVAIFNSDFTTKVAAFKASSATVGVERFIGVKVNSEDQMVAAGVQDATGSGPSLQKFDSSGNNLCWKTDGNNNCYSCLSGGTCPISGQICTTSTGLCGCTGNTECPTNTPLCNTTTGVCYQCTSNSECSSTQICNKLQVCSACSTNAECQAAGHGVLCAAGQCGNTPASGACKTDSDCGVGLLCNTENGECYVGLPPGFSAAVEAANIAMMSAAAALMAASSNPGFGFSIISLFQQFFYLCFLNIPYPLRLQKFYELFEMGILNFFPNLVKPPNSEAAELKLPSPPNLFEHNHTGYFFDTGGTGLCVMLVVLGLFVVLKIVERILKSKEGKLKEKVAKLVDFLQWGGLVRIWLVFCMPIVYASILQLYAVHFQKAVWGVATMVSIIYIIFAIVFIHLAIKIVQMPHDPKKYPFIHAEYKENKADLYIKYAGVFYYTRRVAEPLIIVICYWDPGLQCCLLFFIAIYFAIYQIVKLPQLDSLQNLTMITSDVALCIVYALNLCMLGNTPTNNSGLGLAVVIILTSVLVFLIVVTIIKPIKAHIEKKKAEKELKSKKMPSDSERAQLEKKENIDREKDVNENKIVLETPYPLIDFEEIRLQAKESNEGDEQNSRNSLYLSNEFQTPENEEAGEKLGESA